MIYPVYPILHELGHVIPTIIFKGRVKGFYLYPNPSVLVDLSGFKRWQVWVVGLSGTLFPSLIGLLPAIKKYVFWIISVFIRSISVFHCGMSMMVSVFSLSGLSDSPDDVTMILKVYDNKFLLIAIYCILFFFNCLVLVLDNYGEKIDKYIFSEV